MKRERREWGRHGAVWEGGEGEICREEVMAMKRDGERCGRVESGGARAEGGERSTAKWDGWLRGRGWRGEM